ncbi:MAG: SBBP repeat-containing protein [Deinococcota bacterium]
MNLSQHKRMMYLAGTVLSFVVMLSTWAAVDAQSVDQLTSFWQAGGEQFDAASSVAVAADRSVIVGGAFQGMLTNLTDVDGTSLPDLNATGRDGFIASLDPAGELNWFAQVSSDGDDDILDIATDSLGNVFVSGYISGAAELSLAGETVTLETSSSPAAFIIKLDAAGALQWSQVTTGEDASAYAYGLVGDGDGGVIMAGFVTGEVTLADTQLTAEGASDMLVAHIDADGSIQWIQQLGGPAGDVAYDLARDGDGNLYIAGRFRDSLSLAETTLTARGDRDAMLVSLAADGTPRWAQAWGSEGADVAWAVATSTDAVYVSGYVSDRAVLDPTQPETDDASTLVRTRGTLDSVVLKFSPEGAFIWGQQRGTDGLASSHGLAADRQGVIYDAGRESINTLKGTPGPMQGYLRQYDADGNVLSDTGLELASAQAVTVDRGLTLYVAGYGQLTSADADDSGNIGASDALVFNLIQDNDPPELVQTSWEGTAADDGALLPFLVAGDVLSVQIVADEPLSGAALDLAGTAAELSPTADDTIWQGDLTVPEEVTGEQTVGLGFTDAAGNQARLELVTITILQAPAEPAASEIEDTSAETEDAQSEDTPSEDTSPGDTSPTPDDTEPEEDADSEASSPETSNPEVPSEEDASTEAESSTGEEESEADETP